VSGPYGMGEFARSSAIARAALVRWPNASVHFMLSRAAPYAAAAPFPTTLLSSSATFHSAAVIDLIRRWRPNVVVFDNAGRTAQLRAARASGAHIVFISARRRPRRKAFRLRWMRLIDEHWIAYPQFIAGELGLAERLKLKLLGGPVVRYLDVIFSRAPPASEAARSHVLVIPGGGTGHPGAADAILQFLAAARELAAGGVETKFVGPSNQAGAQSPPCFSAVEALPQADLAALMGRARLVIANGGSTLLQAIACGAACVAVPIARDQRERIRRCMQAGVAVAAALDAADIAAKAGALLRDEPRRLGLARRAAGLELADGIEIALNALDRFIGTA
jgi:hypothetical protein